jgi:glyoxylase-like metal-dependent hydrolase (beta-lactamase superfamily II)
LFERITTWDSSGNLFEGFDVVETPGHTPGSSMIVLSSGAMRAVLLGDVVHCPVELVDEEWETIGDVDPVLARRTATRLARELEGRETLIGAAHFKELRFGRLLVGEGQRSWRFESDG